MLSEKLRDMHASAADSCDPEFNRVLLEAADEIERLRAVALWIIQHDNGGDCIHKNGKPCHSHKCGCAIELQNYINGIDGP